MSSRKRSRSVGQENRPKDFFTISYVPDPSRAEQQRHKNKKRKCAGRDDDKRTQFQKSPFSPAGSFKTNDTMDLYCIVEPERQWRSMTRYNSFVLNSIKYYIGNFVNVANEATAEQRKTRNNVKSSYKSNSDDWVAYILEIRASDEHHVYARVYWMYWPYELPHGTIDGKQKVQGRQTYHGAKELIASNHMDIINVVSVTEPATVRHWNESDDEEIQDEFYWRQAYDCRNSELSLICRCQTPANPDRTLIGCTSSGCGKWLHHECMFHDILMQVYERLGTDKPHRTEGCVAREEISEEATHPQSPADAKQRETQPTTDDCSRETQENFYVKNGIHETLHKTKTLTSRSTPSRSATTALIKGPAKRSRKTNIADKPYMGLFEASLKMQDGPTAWEINDLRENVIGSDKTWTENAHCLLCGAIID